MYSGHKTKARPLERIDKQSTFRQEPKLPWARPFVLSANALGEVREFKRGWMLEAEAVGAAGAVRVYLGPGGGREAHAPLVLTAAPGLRRPANTPRSEAARRRSLWGHILEQELVANFRAGGVDEWIISMKSRCFCYNFIHLRH